MSWGFCQVKKSPNPRKTPKWVGGSSPNSDFFFGGGGLYFLCCFSLLHMFQRKKMDRGVSGWDLAKPSFFWIF